MQGLTPSLTHTLPLKRHYVGQMTAIVRTLIAEGSRQSARTHMLLLTRMPRYVECTTLPIERNVA
jgi:hypothetical protein